MVDLDYYLMSGYAMELLAQSPYHKQSPFGDYFYFEILPAIRLGQIRFYLTEDGIPTAFATWAWLNEDVEKDVISTGRALDEDEWNCGERLFFNDWVTPYGNTREVIRDMSHNVFPNEIATSLRRNMDGSVRRVNRWTGVNVRKKEEKRVAV